MRKIVFALLIIFSSSSLFAATRRHAAANDYCRPGVSPGSVTVPASGGHASVAVTMYGRGGSGGCLFTPFTTASWVAATAAGSAQLSLEMDVAPNNSGAARTALVHVRSAVVVVTQPFEQTNLLTNGSFTSDTRGWSNIFSTGQGSATWATDTPSVISSPPVNRGVVLLTSNQPTTGYQLSQCVAVSPSTTYDAGVSMFIPSTQAHGLAVFALYPYDNATCQGSYLGSMQDYRDTPLDTWFNDTRPLTTDARTKGVLVVIGAGGTTNPPFSAYFDNAFVRPRQP